MKPYDHEPSYPYRWVIDGWDGIKRFIDRDGTVRYAPHPDLPRVPPRDDDAAAAGP